MLVVQQLQSRSRMAGGTCSLIHAAEHRGATTARQTPVEQQHEVTEALAGNEIDPLGAGNRVQQVAIDAPCGLREVLPAVPAPIRTRQLALSHDDCPPYVGI